MKLSALFSAQRIIKQILDWLQQTKGDAIVERMNDVYNSGVVLNELNNMNILGKDTDNTLADFFHVKVATGVAYKSGERILLSDASITYSTSNPSHTTNDGLGNLVSTPLSTGSFNIPLTAGSINYMYIAYLLTCDASVFTLNKITNAKQFYKRTDGYQIVVNTTGSNPDSTLYVFLGQIDLTGSKTAIASNISQVNRDQFRTTARRIGIETSNNSRSDRPTTYAIGQQQLFLDDHIKAVGTGAISPTNPHGTTLADIGVPALETVQDHRQFEHTNGIIGGTPSNSMPTGSSMFCQRVQVSPGDDFITVQALISGEVALVNGLGFDSTAFGAPQNISFTGKAAGTYEVYFDSTTSLCAVILSSSYVYTDTTKLDLCTVVWNTTIPGDGNLGVPLDRRRFGTTNALQRWVTNGRPVFPFPGQFGFNVDQLKLEYYNGSAWLQL